MKPWLWGVLEAQAWKETKCCQFATVAIFPWFDSFYLTRSPRHSCVGAPVIFQTFGVDIAIIALRCWLALWSLLVRFVCPVKDELWCEFDSGVPEQKEGPVIWPIFLPSSNVAPLPNKWQPLSLGTSFAQKEKKLHSGWDSHRAWQASTEVSTGQRAPRKLSSGTYFTFPLMQFCCPAFL